MPTPTKTKKSSVANESKKMAPAPVVEKQEAKTVRKKSAAIVDSNAPFSTSKSGDVQTTRHAANPEERERMIESAAYYIAEKDGFQAGRENDYWYQAVAQVDLLLGTPAQIADKH